MHACMYVYIYIHACACVHHNFILILKPTYNMLQCYGVDVIYMARFMDGCIMDII